LRACSPKSRTTFWFRARKLPLLRNRLASVRPNGFAEAFLLRVRFRVLYLQRISRQIAGQGVDCYEDSGNTLCFFCTVCGLRTGAAQPHRVGLPDDQAGRYMVSQRTPDACTRMAVVPGHERGGMGGQNDRTPVRLGLLDIRLAHKRRDFHYPPPARHRDQRGRDPEPHASRVAQRSRAVSQVRSGGERVGSGRKFHFSVCRSVKRLCLRQQWRGSAHHIALAGFRRLCAIPMGRFGLGAS
jgi:hypothetical protein